MIELESSIGNTELVYLGCNQTCFTLMMESGRMAIVMASDVEEFLGTRVDKYVELAKGQGSAACVQYTSIARGSFLVGSGSCWSKTRNGMSIVSSH